MIARAGAVDSPPPAVSALPSLSEHKLARFAAIVILYFMQGVPVGLTIIAIPAWLAANGASPVQVAAIVGTAMLPWSLKLVNGLVMDRWAFKPMGRRRGWILLAQALMASMLGALAILSPGAADLALLTGLCFALNICATFNDVAVDGMTVDLVPDEERATVNSFMFAAQSTGIAATSFVAGQLLVLGSITPTALILAGFVALASLFVSIFRERPGERLLPWSAGEASRECKERQHDAWWPILKGVFVSMLAPLTVLFLLSTGLAMATAAYQDAIAPTLAVQQLGWGSDSYSSFASAMSLLAALITALVATFIVKTLGLRNAIIATFLVHAGAALFAAITYPSWEGDTIFSVVFFVQYVAHMMILVFTCTWAMRLCNPAVAASQFALFMAVPNFARSLMSGNSGFVVEWGGYGAVFYCIAAIALLGLMLGLLARIGNARALD